MGLSEAGDTSLKPAFDPASEWDVVIVGTGMGGGAVGLRLAQAGLSVLFLEKGDYARASSADEASDTSDAQTRLQAGRWPEKMRFEVDGGELESFPAMACAVGGSTAIYSATLERLEQHDIDELPGVAHPTGGWPVRFAAFSRFYEEAEAVLGVRGTSDPRRPGTAVGHSLPAMRQSDACLMADLAQAGLKPYRMHVGIAYKPGCLECLGFPCPQSCKSDALSRFIAPALELGAVLSVRTEALRLELDRDRVTGLLYRCEGQEGRVSAKIFVLAAGALSTPLLLLRSATSDQPLGAANSSGLVGKNLMFHADDWLAIWPSRPASMIGPAKTIASRALYLVAGERYGMLQSTGLTAGYGNILLFLRQSFDRSGLAWLKPLRSLLRIPAKIGAKVFGSATILALLIEDFPYKDNRVELGPDGKVVVRYTFRRELRDRCAKAREMIDHATQRCRSFWPRPEAILNLGHPMGTCRFGDDPATSVLDPNCRTHDVGNLYVVDASFMPTGGGVNPSLTVAANALRVAEFIRRQLSSADAHQTL